MLVFLTGLRHLRFAKDATQIKTCRLVNEITCYTLVVFTTATSIGYELIMAILLSNEKKV